MKLTKYLKIVVVATITMTMVAGVDVYAQKSYDNDYSYKFAIGGWFSNGRVEKGKYRQTSNTQNAWKVQLKSSGEGKGTITNFWLEKSDESNVTRDISAQQGARAIYDSTKSSANKTTVYLTGENNNFNGDCYVVSGVWDEETGIIVNH